MVPYQDIQGWFDFESVYRLLMMTVPPNGCFVECGAWLGRSSNFLCGLRNDVNVYIVDHWKGSINERDTHHALAKEANLYSLFRKNMKGLQYSPLKMESRKAATRFDQHSVDVVFIDMDHDYESVIADVHAWLPKVRPGGIIAGHDYGSPDWPGVKSAVDEIFGVQNIQVLQNCWAYRLPDRDLGGPELTIITPVTRPKNIPKIHQSFRHIDPYLRTTWIQVRDARPDSGGGRKRNHGLDMACGCQGWIYHLDDDTHFHENFGKNARELIEMHPLAKLIIFQHLLNRDGTIRLNVEPGQPIQVGRIDTAQFLVHSSITQQFRWEENNYMSDGVYVAMLANSVDPASIAYCEKPCVIYNALRQAN